MGDSTIQEVQTKKPIKCVSQDNCTSISSEAPLFCNSISHVACTWPVSLGKKILASSDYAEFEPVVFSSYQLCHNVKEGRTQA
eukprot:9474208-Ditylum_brightwellii.AAC.1